MEEEVLEELMEAIRSRFLKGLMLEESLEQLQSLLSKTVYHYYKQFSRSACQETEEVPPSIPPIESEGTAPGHDSNNNINNDVLIIEDDIPDVNVPIENSLVEVSTDQTIQTSPVELLSENEQDMLYFIREHRINIVGIASLAFGVPYNYSKKRYIVETEDILFDSEDECTEIDADESLRVGMGYSNLNKLAMNLINGTPTNNIVVLNKILKTLIQDYNVMYRDLIMDLIDQIFRVAEPNTNSTEAQIIGRQQLSIENNTSTTQVERRIELTSIAVNTDLTGEVVNATCQKRKTMKSRPDVIPNIITRRRNRSRSSWIPQEERVQVPEPVQSQQQQFGAQHHSQNQYMQQLHNHQNVQQSIHLNPVPQDCRVNCNMVNQPSVNKPACQHQYNAPYCGNFQQPSANIQQTENAMIPFTKPNEPTPGNSSQRQQVPLVTEFPMALVKRSQKTQSPKQTVKQIQSQKQSLPTMMNSTINPARHAMYPMVPYHEISQHRADNNYQPTQRKQPYNPHFGPPNMPEGNYSDRTPSKNMQTLPPNMYQIPSADHQLQAPMNQMQAPVGNQINTLETMPPYGNMAIAPYPIGVPALDTAENAFYPEPDNQMNFPNSIPSRNMQQMLPLLNVPPPRKERPAIPIMNPLFRGIMPPNNNNFNQMAMNPYYRNNMQVPPRMQAPGVGWDPQTNTYMKNRSQNMKLCDTY